MPRVSIAKQMGVIAFLALALAALRTGSPVLADLMLTIVLGLLAIAALKAVYSTGGTRASWAGFAFFGFCYLTLSFGPWFATEMRPHLFTSHLLKDLHGAMAVAPPPGAIFETDGRRYYVPPSPAVVRYTWYDFERSGHALVAFACGLIGAILGHRFASRRDSA